jgi:hypothetical protein
MWVRSNTEITKNEAGEVINSSYTRNVQGLTFNDPETAESWAYADRMARESNGDNFDSEDFRILGIYNNTSEYVIKIESEPFLGITLAPGEKTKIKKSFPVGLYKLVYSECKIGDSRCVKMEINISIDRHRTMPITITKK